MSMTRTAQRISLAAVLMSVATLAAAPALAAQAPAATLTACYVPKSGTVYRIKAPNAPTECTKNDHVEFSWREQGLAGPQGPQGPQGVAGPVGPQGPAGPSGVRAYARVWPNGTLDTAKSRGIVSVTSPVLGKYCVTPEPGISPELHPAVVSQTGDHQAALMWDNDLIGIGTCAVGQYGIAAFSTSTGTSSPTGFTIIIP